MASMEQVVLVQAHMSRLQFEMGQTLKPWAPLTRTFVALDNAVTLVNPDLIGHQVRFRVCLLSRVCVCACFAQFVFGTASWL